MATKRHPRAPDNMVALAERCEQASGPSRHLDTQIAILLDPDTQRIVGHELGRFPQKAIYGPRSSFWEWATDESKEPPIFAVTPHYTASLDSAMTLVPEGWHWQIIADQHNNAHCWRDGDEFTKPGKGATPALALAAAALRARAALKSPGSGL